MDRETLLQEAVDRCMKELYSYAQPKVEWDDFVQQNKEYSEKYRQWEAYHTAKRNNGKTWEEWKQIHPDWEDKKIDECIGLRPYEFYYLPEKVMRTICDSYTNAYELDKQKELKEIKDTLINYCKEPIVDTYVDDEFGKKVRSYKHLDSLESELKATLGNKNGSKAWELMVKYLNMATNFFCWNRELNAFNGSVYLGGSPHSVKETVIKNWKEHRGKDIEIDDEVYNNFYDKYYGWYEEDYEEEDNGQ